VRIPRPEATPLSALALLPRESLERACRHAERALGTPVALFDEESKGERDGCSWVSLCVLPSAPIEDAVFCANAADIAEEDQLPAVRYASARAFAAIPLTARAGQGAEEGASRPALVVLAGATRHWRLAERHALQDVATSLASELDARAELAELHLRIDEMRRDALRDPLTALPTRALFLDHLDLAVERARRHKDFRFAVLSLDLDRFQTVNDSLGHEAGDELLVAVSRRLQSCVRGEDTVARLSADEFAILLESLADDSDGGRVAERIQRALGAPVETKEGDVFTSASIGIVLSSSGLDTPQELLQRAGIAVARAKAAGRARYEMFDRAMQARARARLRTETDLHRAVERGEFQVYYQPLVTLDSGRITEVEALLRWRHPDRGIVPPLDFIPLAEETGLIIPIGSWILAEACRQTRQWQSRYQRETPLALSVNLSVKQFSQPEFVRHVASTLAASGLDPHSLKLEITESFAIEDAELTREMLEELRRLGTRIYLDDFGTGYSSLGYLHRLPLDAIKIDRSFVMQMDAGPTHLKLVDTVRALAHNIGVAAVAEGVETEAQLRTLRALGCESAQGFLFSRPVPPAEIEALLERDPRW
jgi:diguanylate cyclase (GGDEF)-like protein